MRANFEKSKILELLGDFDEAVITATNSRHVLGIMNDLAKHIAVYMADYPEKIPHHEIIKRINETPFRFPDRKMEFPVEVLQRMLR